MSTDIQEKAREGAFNRILKSEVERAVAARTAELVTLLGASQALAAEHRHAATHDTLTGLLNRQGLTDTWAQANPTGLIMLDLNGFKPVNDTYGHAAGDIVLKVVGERLAELDAIAVRLGGDEFVLIAGEGVNPHDLGTQAYKSIQEPITLSANLTVSVSAAVGIRVLDGPADLSEVLAQADEATYEAKKFKATGRDTVAVWASPVTAREALAQHDMRLRDVHPTPARPVFVHAAFPVISGPVEPTTVCALCGELLGYQGVRQNGHVRQVPVHVEAGDCDTPEPAMCTHHGCHADHSLDTTCSELRDRCCGRCGCLSAYDDFEVAE